MCPKSSGQVFRGDGLVSVWSLQAGTPGDVGSGRLPLKRDWVLEDFWNQMCFPPTCKCLQSTMTGSIRSLKHSKVLTKGPEPLTIQGLAEGPRDRGRTSSEQRQKLPTLLLEANSAVLTGPWEMPPSSHQIGSALVLAHLAGPS